MAILSFEGVRIADERRFYRLRVPARCEVTWPDGEVTITDAPVTYVGHWLVSYVSAITFVVPVTGTVTVQFSNCPLASIPNEEEAHH